MEENITTKSFEELIRSGEARRGIKKSSPASFRMLESSIMAMETEPEKMLHQEKVTQTKKSRNTLKRGKEIMTRLTEEEYDRFLRRLEVSGMPQGEYIRRMVLSGKVIVEERSDLVIALMDELMSLRVEVGKQGALLKSIIRPNEGQRELSPGEWDDLIAAIKKMEIQHQRISKMEAMICGNR